MAAPSTYTALSAAVAEVRSTVYPNVRYVAGANNATTDTAAIQSALAAAALAEPRTVVLSGDFRVSDTLVVPTVVRLVGDPYARISWYGSATSNPIVSVTGTRAELKNLRLYCRYLSRGIKCYQAWYGQDYLLDHIAINDSTELALEMIDCWGSNIQNLNILNSHGVAIRQHRCNSTHYNNVRIGSQMLFWHTNGAASGSFAQADNVAMWEYANTHTLAQTRTNYGADCLEDWPSTDDVAAADRAVIVIDDEQDLTTWTNLLLEPCATGELPLMSIQCTTSAFRNIRMEGGYHNTTSKLIRVVGDNWKKGTNLTFDGVFVLTAADGEVGYVFGLETTTKNVSANMVHAGAGEVLLGILNKDADTHTNTTVTNYIGASDAGGTSPLDSVTITA